MNSDTSRKGNSETKESSDVQGSSTPHKARIINYPFASRFENTSTPSTNPNSSKTSVFQNAPWHIKTAIPAKPPIVNTSFKPPNSLNPPNSQVWPPALWYFNIPFLFSEYVDRCFQKCTSDGHRLFVEDSLKKLLNRCLLENSLNSTDWEKVPLISVTSQEKVSDEQPQQIMNVRAQRFSNKTPPTASPQKPKKETNELSWNHAYIVGTSTSIEKDYLRLTATPDPSSVRPLHILKKTLVHLKQKWKSGTEYSYLCDQFKSLRQDLTVQGILDDFTVNVYEVHARIALEMVQYNCFISG